MVYEIIPYGRTTNEKYFRVFIKSLEKCHKVALENKTIFKDFRTILVTDKTDKMLKNINIKNIEIIHVPLNTGAGTMRNIGLESLKNLKENDYFTFMDSDDKVNKNYYIYNGEETDLIQTSRIWWKGIFKNKMDKYFNKATSSKVLLEKSREGLLGEQVWGRFYKSKFLKYRFVENGIWEDGIYLRQILSTNPTYSFNKTSKYYWRRNNVRSLTTSYVDKNVYESSKQNLKTLVKDSIEHNINASMILYSGLSLLESFEKENLESLISYVLTS